MEITTIIAYVVVVFTMFFGMTFGETGFNVSAIGNFFQVQSIFITIGGTFFVLLAAFPIKSFTHIPKHLKMIFFKNKQLQSEKVAKWTDHTLKTLGTSYKTILTEAGVIDRSKGNRKILKPILDRSLEDCLVQNGMAVTLHALTGVR